MKLKFHKNAIKFLDKINDDEKQKIKAKIQSLTNIYYKTGIIPYQELQIKGLDGKWKGFYRMRVGKKRIIFGLDPINWEMNIYEIDIRGDIYKS